MVSLMAAPWMPPALAGDAVSVQLSGGQWKVTTASYVATSGRSGYLGSLIVDGQECLVVSDSGPSGSYLAAPGKKPRLDHLASEGNRLTGNCSLADLAYTFAEDRVTLSITSHQDGVHLYMLLNPAVTRLGSMAKIGDVPTDTTVPAKLNCKLSRWYQGETALVDVSGSNGLWMWHGHQLWDAVLAQGETRTIEMAIAPASLSPVAPAAPAAAQAAVTGPVVSPSFEATVKVEANEVYHTLPRHVWGMKFTGYNSSKSADTSPTSADGKTYADLILDLKMDWLKAAYYARFGTPSEPHIIVQNWKILADQIVDAGGAYFPGIHILPKGFPTGSKLPPEDVENMDDAVGGGASRTSWRGSICSPRRRAWTSFAGTSPITSRVHARMLIRPARNCGTPSRAAPVRIVKPRIGRWFTIA
jgi:hypothetical protein